MEICQPITAKAESGKSYVIIILNSNNKFYVLMSDIAFPAKPFDSAVDALKEAINTLKNNQTEDKIISLYSPQVEEFLSNDAMNTIL